MDIGLGKQKITPQESVGLAGYAACRSSTQKLDDLYVNVVLCHVNNTYYGLFSYDLIAVDHLIIDGISTKLNTNGYDPSHFLFCATHTHAGPGGVIDCEQELLKPSKSVFGAVNKELIQEITNKSMQAFYEAVTNLKKGMIKYSYGNLPYVGSNRNALSYPGNDHIFVLYLYQGNQWVASLINFACHPTILNDKNSHISADFPGAIQKQMESMGIPYTIYCNGCCGDISTRFTRRNSSYEEVQRFGSMFVPCLLDLQTQAQAFDLSPLSIRSLRVSMMLKKTDSLEIALAKLHQRVEELRQARKTGASVSSLRLMESYLEGAQANLRYASNPFSKDSYEVTIHIVTCGHHQFLFIPGELFSQLTNSLESEFVHFFCYTNGYIGYFADKEAYQNHSYEALISPFQEGESEKLIHRITQNLTRRNET